jgi:hypothetical protein
VHSFTHIAYPSQATSFYVSKWNAAAAKSSSQTVGVFGGSVVVGGLEVAPVGGACVGGWGSAGGAVGLGVGRRAFLRFTVFADFFPFFLGKISPTYRLPRIADKALIFDGNITLRKLRSCLAWTRRYVAM